MSKTAKAHSKMRNWHNFCREFPKIFYRNERMKIGFEFQLGDEDFKSELTPLVQALEQAMTSIKNIIKEY